MHINFKSVELFNFMSVGYGKVELSEQGYVSIIGVNNNPQDNAKSNGSGKSTIIEAIVYALTGETVRGTNDVINRILNQGCKVILDFSVDSTNYKLVRTKEDKELGTNLKIYVNGEDKSGKGIRDSQHILEEYLPDLTPELIGSVIILGQGLPNKFSNNTPSGRKAVLEKLSKSDFMIDDIKDKISNRKIELSNELRKVEDEILADSSKQSILENKLVNLKNDKALLDASANIDYDTDIKKYEEQLDLYENTKIDLEYKVADYQNKIDIKLKEYQDWVGAVQSNILSESAHIEDNEGLTDINNVIRQNELYISSKEQEIIKLENIKDVCPTCGQHLPDVHKVDTTKLKEDLQFAKDENCKIIEHKKQIQEIVNNKIQVLKDSLNSTTEKIKNEGSKLREEFNTLNNQLQNYIIEINNIKLNLDKIKLNKENYEKQSKTIDTDIQTTEDEIKTFSEKILYNNIGKDNINKHLEVISKMNTFATRDFRGYLLSEIISFIDLKLKEYSLEMFGHNNITFEQSGNNLNISYLDKDYESLSGGEKQKIDILIQFALRDMLVKHLGFNSNLLVLDEVFDNLDIISCQKVIDLITNKLNDIESIFVITHHAEDLSIPSDRQIIVVKNEQGISEIQ